MKNRFTSIILGLLIGQVIVISFRSCNDHNRINEIIVERNRHAVVIDSMFWTCADLAEIAIKQRDSMKKQNDSLKNEVWLKEFYKSESNYYNGLCHKIVKDETAFVKKMIKQVKEK